MPLVDEITHLPDVAQAKVLSKAVKEAFAERDAARMAEVGQASK